MMRENWQDFFRHKLVTFVNRQFAMGRIGVDDLFIYGRKGDNSRISLNLGHIGGDRQHILSEVLKTIVAALPFFSADYDEIVIVGFRPEELPLVKREGWAEIRSSPLSALSAIRKIERGCPQE